MENGNNFYNLTNPSQRGNFVAERKHRSMNFRENLLAIATFVLMWLAPILLMEHQVLARQRVMFRGQEVSVNIMRGQRLAILEGLASCTTLSMKNGKVIATSGFGVPKRPPVFRTYPANPEQIALYRQFF